jgi:hypothetical protein
MSAQGQWVFDLDAGAVLWVRFLDEINAEEAVLATEEFRTKPGAQVNTSDPTLRLTLLPYAVARIDG